VYIVVKCQDAGAVKVCSCVRFYASESRSRSFQRDLFADCLHHHIDAKH